MIVSLQVPTYEISKEEQEKMYFDDLIFNTHKWVEYREGYYQCEFCEAIHTSNMPIQYKNICTKNPYIGIPK
jgi:hypothetical protein